MPSVEEKAKVGRWMLVAPAGPESIEIGGAVVSTVKLLEAGVGSAVPKVSRARTSNVWAPSASVGVVWKPSPGPEQAPNAAPSTRHSKLTLPWSEEKLKVGWNRSWWPGGQSRSESPGGPRG